MSTISKKFHSKSIDNSGFGSNSNVEGGRLTNKDGSINLRKTGTSFFKRYSLYHVLIRLPRIRFLLLVFTFYTVINVFFAFLYVLVGVDKLEGTQHSSSFFVQYWQAFFFSSQTLTTVGYGHVAPTGLIANSLASIESFAGIMAFALVTGLFYARFSRPRAHLLFSKNLLLTPYKDGNAFMLRVASQKNNHLTDAEAQVTTAFHIEENGKRVTRFYPLILEISRVNSLALSWTIVHYIDEKSPFWGFSEQDLRDANIEVMITIKAFDDHYSNLVQQRTSYAASEIIYGAKFIPAFARSEDGSHTILELDKINAFIPADIHKI
jgi:inward rectifier potassium channel